MRQLLNLLIGGTLLCGDAAAEVPLEPRAFTAVVIQALSERADPSAKLSSPEPLSIHVQLHGRLLEANVVALRRECAALVGFCHDALKRYVTSWLEFVGGPPDQPKPNQLRVLVRDAEYTRQLIATHARTNAAPPIVRPYIDELWMVLSVVGETINWIASSKALASMGLDESAAFDIALRNMKAAVPRLAHVARPLHGPFSVATGEYDSSRILLHSDWSSVARAQRGELLVAVPATDVLVFGSSDDPNDAARLKQLTEEIMQQAGNPLSAKIYRWRPQGWEILTEADYGPVGSTSTYPLSNYLLPRPAERPIVGGNYDKMQSVGGGNALQHP